MKDPVFTILSTMLANSPEASYVRLNGALCGTLRDCINADLPFRRDTFSRIYKELRGGWWFGDGAGSAMGEHFYTLACSVNHASAYQSFEAFAGRPGVLWENDAGNPARLHVGAQFHWKGHYVTVTSMRADRLVACTYKGGDDKRNEGVRVGNIIGKHDKPFVVTASKKDGKAVVLRVAPTEKKGWNSEINRRFTISYAEIIEFRRTASARLKAVLKRIRECNPEQDREAIRKEVAAAHFRHWELEQVNAAINEAFKAVFAAEAQARAVANRKADFAKWRAGKGEGFCPVDGIFLRLKNDRVECSNGNSVTRDAVARVMPLLLDRKTDAMKRPVAVGLPLDGYQVERLDRTGVKVGCTVVPWTEVEHVAKVLKAA